MDYSLTMLPVEIIYQILLMLSPQDLVRLQRVSKLFYAIIAEPSFWRVIYADIRLPRPPGPFSWQSTTFLRRTLLQSARLARSWTSEPANVVSTHYSLHKVEFPGMCEWACGRWLVVGYGTTQLVSYDIDTGSQQTLCGWDGRSVSWRVTCCMSSRGHLHYVACQLDSEDTVRLLEFHVDDDSGHLSGPVSFDVPIMHRFIQLKSGNTPFVFISAVLWEPIQQTVVFDTRCRIFYEFPKFRPSPDTIRGRPFWVLLTMTHVILWRPIADGEQLIQVFVIPEDGTRVLLLSHQTATRGIDGESWTTLRNPVVDPITGSTHLRIFNVWPSIGFTCVHLTMPAYDVANVPAPISISTHDLFSVVTMRDTDDRCMEASTDGIARGFCIVSLGRGGREPRPMQVCKFSIDASGEQCVGVIGDPSPLPLRREVNPSGLRTGLHFDGTRGRYCYLKQAGHWNSAAGAVDLS